MQRFAANALPLNVQQFSRFRSKADIQNRIYEYRPSHLESKFATL